MTETLTQFAARRLSDLEAARAPLIAELHAIEHEISQLRRVMGAAAPTAKRRVPKIGTIKSAVLAVLSAHPAGLPSRDIVPKVNALLRASFLRTTVAPQLARLVGEGWLAHSHKAGVYTFIKEARHEQTTPQLVA